MGIICRQLEGLGIAQREEAIDLERIETMKGAAVMNSWTPAAPVGALAAIPIPASIRFLNLLQEAYELENPVPL